MNRSALKTVAAPYVLAVSPAQQTALRQTERVVYSVQRIMRKFTRCIITGVSPELGPAGPVQGSVLPPAGCRRELQAHDAV